MLGDNRGSKVEWGVEAGCRKRGRGWEGGSQQAWAPRNTFNCSVPGFSFGRRNLGVWSGGASRLLPFPLEFFFFLGFLASILATDIMLTAVEHVL